MTYIFSLCGDSYVEPEADDRGQTVFGCRHGR